ncbi:hypothetical protein NE237_007436 [Protea cynaroides]|uniref:ATP-dependent Clp protease proteolytic subunit n=1 Tax=Protea cynaroides TaxID=273540 RepID=A0A9Q0QWD9_9MAGN|nr:hypothetical protein NE237_007436 [Protea cynaroides]
MVYLSIEDDTRDLYLFINSPGGWVIPGIAIYDTMQFVPPDVHTICMGLAASMGSFILVGGEITKRLAFPHAWVMIHQPASSFYEAQTGEFVLEAEELLKLRETLTRVYVITDYMQFEFFLSQFLCPSIGFVLRSSYDYH